MAQNNLTDYSSPVQIPGTTWDKMHSSVYGTVAIKTDGTLWGWGRNPSGQLGQNSKVNYSSPVQIPGTNWSSITMGEATTAATKTDGTLWIWGEGSLGRLGQNANVDYSSPIQIPGTWVTTQGKLFGRHRNYFALKEE